MTDLVKCQVKPGGYAGKVCTALLDSVDFHRRGKRMKGLFLRNIVNIDTRERKGSQFVLYQGDFLANGIVLNFCPFCGGPLRDTSSDGATT